MITPPIKDEAFRTAIQELGENFGEYLIMSKTLDPRVTKERKALARERAEACQRAILYFKNQIL